MSYAVMILTHTDDNMVCTDRCSTWFTTKEEAIEYAHTTMKLRETEMEGIYVNAQGTAYFGIAAR